MEIFTKIPPAVFTPTQHSCQCLIMVYGQSDVFFFGFIVLMIKKRKKKRSFFPRKKNHGLMNLGKIIIPLSHTRFLVVSIYPRQDGEEDWVGLALSFLHHHSLSHHQWG